jgi:hypothetical protein
MNAHSTAPTTHRRTGERTGERGAALITVLLLSTLLLTAGGTLILTTSMTASSSFDAVSELQAYEAAEAGLQEAMSALRGNAAPNPVLATNPSTGVNPANLLDFRRAVTRLNSNKPTDPAKNADNSDVPLRLSRWLPYNYTRPGNTYPDRVTLNPATEPFSPFRHSSYSVEVIDPDYPTPASIEAKLADPTYVPERLIIQATGYGPKGARKQLRTVVTRLFFNIQTPSTIVIRGADDKTIIPNFETGNSNAKEYSGQDQTYPSAPNRPAIAISLHDWKAIHEGMKKPDTISDPKLAILDLDPVPNIPSPIPALNIAPLWPAALTPIPAVKPLSVPTPYFIRTADAARAFVQEARDLAKDMGRYYTAAQFASQLGGVANEGTSDDSAFTFVDGDMTLNGGKGLLIATGKITIGGNDDFQGIVLLLGAGQVERNGGGNGQTLGSWIIARFGPTGGFLAPSFDTSGGGNSDFLFDSASISNANAMAGRRTLGVVER